jgi:hypothetical protein
VTYTPAFDSVVVREAAFFADPAPDGGTYPPLSAAAGGPFDTVQGYFPREQRRLRELFIVRTRSIEERYAFGGIRLFRHLMAVYTYWPLSTATGSVEQDQQEFDTAMAAVLTRIRGKLGDKSHNGAFVSVGEGENRDIIDVQFGDVRTLITAREPLTGTVIYPAYDEFPA